MRFRLLLAFSELTNEFFNGTFDYVIMCRRRRHILDRAAARARSPCDFPSELKRETPVTAVTRKPCLIGCARVELMSSRGDGFLTDCIHWMNLCNNWIEYVFNCIISIKLSPFFFFGCAVFCPDPLKLSMCWRRSDEKVSEHGRSSAFRLTNNHRIISLNSN